MFLFQATSPFTQSGWLSILITALPIENFSLSTFKANSDYTYNTVTVYSQLAHTYWDQSLTNQAYAFSSSISWSCETTYVAIGVSWEINTCATMESDVLYTHALWLYVGLTSEQPLWWTAAGPALICDLVSSTSDISSKFGARMTELLAPQPCFSGQLFPSLDPTES